MENTDLMQPREEVEQEQREWMAEHPGWVNQTIYVEPYMASEHVFLDRVGGDGPKSVWHIGSRSAWDALNLSVAQMLELKGLLDQWAKRERLAGGCLATFVGFDPDP